MIDVTIPAFDRQVVYEESLRKLYWHEYFLALRARDGKRAATFRELAQRQQRAKKERTQV